MLLPAALALLGLLTLAAWRIEFDAVRAYLDRFAGDGSADRYDAPLHRRLQWGAGAIGTVCLGLALGCTAVLRWRSDQLAAALSRVQEETRERFREIAATLNRHKAMLLLFVIISVASRLPWIHQPMRYDEAHTWMEFSSQPWFVTVSKYDDPNNHILHSLLMKPAMFAFGQAPWALRLPSFFFGCLLAPLTFLLGRLWGGYRIGWLAGLAVALSPILIEYSTTARGYTLLTFFSLLAWMAAIDLQRRPSLFAAGCLVLCGALGLWTIPTMLFPLAMIWTWLVLASRGRLFGRTAAIAVATGALTALLYSPALLAGDPVGRLAQHPAPSRPSLWSQAPGHLEETIGLLFRDAPPWLLIVLLGLITIGMFFPAGQRRPEFAVAGALFAALTVVFLTGQIPPPRVWVFLVPWLLVLAAMGWERLVGASRFRSFRTIGWSMMVVIPFLLMVRHDSIANSLEGGVCPEAQDILRELQPAFTAKTRLVAVAPVSALLVYYAQADGAPMTLFNWPQPEDDVYVLPSLSLPQEPIDVVRQLGMKEFETAGFQLQSSHPSARVFRVVMDRDP